MKEMQVLENVWVKKKDEINRLKESKFSISKILLKGINDTFDIQNKEEFSEMIT